MSEFEKQVVVAERTRLWTVGYTGELVRTMSDYATTKADVAVREFDKRFRSGTAPGFGRAQ